MKGFRRKWPEQETWVMRNHRLAGTPYNPDTTCEYTGLALWMFPTPQHTIPGVWDDPWCMGFYRADGHLRGIMKCTPEELAWLAANPVAYQAEKAEFEAWLSSTRNP